MDNMIGKSLANVDLDASKAKNHNEKLMSPNAQEDMETVTGDNPQKAWMPGGSKPMAPFGPRGRNF